MLSDRKALIRKMIEEAKPAHDYFAERANPINIELASLYTGKFAQQELRAVSAVVAYVAYSQNVSAELVVAILTTAFGVKAVKDFERDQFDDVVRYLVNFNFAEAIN